MLLAYRLTRPYAIALGALVLSACGGGTGSTVPVAFAPPSGMGTATLSITVPAGAPLIVPRGNQRRPAYVSPGTKRVVVYINGSQTPSTTVALPAPTGSPATYQISVEAPYGTDTFRVDLVNALAIVLSTGTSAPTPVVSGTPTKVTIMALGVPAFAVFGIADASTRPPAGSVTTIPLNLKVTDADGYEITGTFSNPISIDTFPGAAGGSGYSLSARTAASKADANAITLTSDGTVSGFAIHVFVTLYGDLNLTRNNVGAVVIRPGALPTGNAVLVASNPAPGVSVLSRVDAASYAASVVGTYTVPMTALAASPDGRVAYIGFGDGTIRIYDGRTKAVGTPKATGGTAVVALSMLDYLYTPFALVKSGGSFGVVQYAFDSPQNSPVLLPVTATGCTGITGSATQTESATVSCTDATYRVDVGIGGQRAPSVVATRPGSGGNVVEGVATSFVYAANAGGAVNAFNAASPLTSVATISVPAGATGLALDPSEHILYVGAQNTFATARLLRDGTGNTVRSLAVPGTLTSLADFPGSPAAPPDATVWGTNSNGSLNVIDTATNTLKQTVTIPGVPVGLGFVP